jgi:hypothetical protein
LKYYDCNFDKIFIIRKLNILRNVMKNIIRILGIVILFILIHSCKKEKNTNPTITTAEVINITSTSAACGGNLTYSGTFYSIIWKGVSWTTNPNLEYDIQGNTLDGSGTGIFTSKITGLKENTTYYVRAYVYYYERHIMNFNEYTVYGNQVTFKTLQSGQK